MKTNEFNMMLADKNIEIQNLSIKHEMDIDLLKKENESLRE